MLNWWQMLQPKYTMQGFEWKEQRGVEGTGFVRALRSRLTSHLPRLYSDLEICINNSLNREWEQSASNGEFRSRTIDFGVK